MCYMYPRCVYVFIMCETVHAHTVAHRSHHRSHICMQACVDLVCMRVCVCLQVAPRTNKISSKHGKYMRMSTQE